tara:strand:+ start:637 stop:918 length:282 start_codon:yes stop_codon:yes gene_type:complete
MTAGDIVSGISSAVNTPIIFIPAAGVSCVVTTAYNNSYWANITDGTLLGRVCNTIASATSTTLNMKMFISNSMYLNVDLHPSLLVTFTGIQIK